MAELMSLLFNLAPFLLLAIVVYHVLEAFWAVCLWVYGLRTLWKLHRDDLWEALSLERALSPFTHHRDMNGNLPRPPT